MIQRAVDGFSRVVVFLQGNTNNRADTVLLFNKAVNTFGLPTRIRCDHGTENIDVARLMLDVHGVEGNHVLTGLSVHNQCIERLRVDVVRYIVVPYRNIFTHLENSGLLDPANEVHLYALHCVYQPRINRSIDEFILQWNNHGLSSPRCQTPMQLMFEGLYNSLAQGDSNYFVGISEGYGIDDDAPMPELQTINDVQVPRSAITLSPTQQEMLVQLVDPFSHDQSQWCKLIQSNIGSR